jgi:hypothetical protein
LGRASGMLQSLSEELGSASEKFMRLIVSVGDAG